MRISQILSWVMVGYFGYRVGRMYLYGTQIPKQLYVVMLYLALPYMLEFFPYGNLLVVAYKAFELVTGWKFFTFAVFLWVCVEIMYARVHMVRVFVNKHRKVLWNIVLWYFFLVCYAKVNEYYRPDNGTCKALTAYEYFKQPKGVVNNGRFLAVCCHALLIFVILFGSFVFLMYFYVPITIS